MKNPFVELHHEFRQAGASVLLSSGQACVLYGIAAFSKDGDWIIREDAKSFEAVLDVLRSKGAQYRLGAPLDVQWLRKGWTSHLEFITTDRFRVRADFCSRPPRVQNVESLWDGSVSLGGVNIVDVENLILLKKTRRVRDYYMIGSLAESLGLEKDEPQLALLYLQDFDLLKKAVDRWPDEARNTRRAAVELMVSGAERSVVVSAIAQEQDEAMRQDAHRVERAMALSVDYVRRFATAKKKWIDQGIDLRLQHEELLQLALPLLKLEIP